MSQPSASTVGETGSSLDESLEWLVDEAARESFPASDPPCWTLGRERLAHDPSLRQIKRDDDDNDTSATD